MGLLQRLPVPLRASIRTLTAIICTLADIIRALTAIIRTLTPEVGQPEGERRGAARKVQRAVSPIEYPVSTLRVPCEYPVSAESRERSGSAPWSGANIKLCLSAPESTL